VKKRHGARMASPIEIPPYSLHTTGPRCQAGQPPAGSHVGCIYARLKINRAATKFRRSSCFTDMLRPPMPCLHGNVNLIIDLVSIDHGRCACGSYGNHHIHGNDCFIKVDHVKHINHHHHHGTNASSKSPIRSVQPWFDHRIDVGHVD
jgi:hypothetical protein